MTLSLPDTRVNGSRVSLGADSVIRVVFHPGAPLACQIGDTHII